MPKAIAPNRTSQGTKVSEDARGVDTSSVARISRAKSEGVTDPVKEVS